MRKGSAQNCTEIDQQETAYYDKFISYTDDYFLTYGLSLKAKSYKLLTI